MFSFYFKTTKKEIKIINDLGDLYIVHSDYMKLRKTLYNPITLEIVYYSIAHYPIRLDFCSH